MPTQIFGYNREVLLGSRSSTMALVDNIIYIFLSAACHHASASEQTFLVTLSASGSIETGKYWKLGGGGRGGKWDLWSLAAEKINKCHLIRPISVSQWGLSSRSSNWHFSLLKQKEKTSEGRERGRRSAGAAGKATEKGGRLLLPPGHTWAGTYVPCALENKAFLEQHARVHTWQAEGNCSFLPYKVPSKASPCCWFPCADRSGNI